MKKPSPSKLKKKSIQDKILETKASFDSSDSSDSESSKKMTKLKNKNDFHRRTSSASSDSEISETSRRSPRKVTPFSKHKKADAEAAEMIKLKRSSAVRNSKPHEMSCSSDMSEDEIEDISVTESSHTKQSDSQASDSQNSSESDPAPSKSASKSPRGSISSDVHSEVGKQKTAKGSSSVKKRTVSKSNVLSSDSEGDDYKTPVKSIAPQKPKNHRTSQANGDTSPVRGSIHTLEKDVDRYQLWLIKRPADLQVSSWPKEIMLNGIQDFSRNEKSYELLSFTDEVVQRNFKSFIQDESEMIKEGPGIKGQTQFVSKPNEPLRPVTAPLITHKSVPFPSGLKVRFTPFGADAPELKDKLHQHKKHKKRKSSGNLSLTLDTTGETDLSPKKKKKKKKHKHSCD